MSSGEFIAALAANFIVAGAVYYLKGPSFGVICLGAGFILMVVAYLLRKKPSATPQQTITQTQEVNPHFHQEFNPTIQIGFPAAEPAISEQEKLRRENLVLDFMNQQRQRQPDRTLTYLVEGVASGAHLNMQQAREALESLYLRNLLYRSTIEAEGDFVYWLR
jgi:hypothetical protein